MSTLTAYYANIYTREAARLGELSCNHLSRGNLTPAKALAREAYRCAVYAESLARGRYPDRFLPIVAGEVY